MEIYNSPQTTSNIIIANSIENINIYFRDTDASDGIEWAVDTDIQSDKKEIEELKRIVSDIYDIKKQNNMKLAARYKMIAKKSTELSTTDNYYERKYESIQAPLAQLFL